MTRAAIVATLLVIAAGWWRSSAALLVLGLYLLLLSLWIHVCLPRRESAQETERGGELGELIDLSDVDWSAWRPSDRRPAA